VATEVNVAACETRNIPILRRCSGGGTVLQGPGCLNYSLILRGNGPLANITSANRFIMEKNRAAIQSAVHSPQSAVEVYGYTDLAIGHPTSAIRHPLKFSGNAQRRRKQFLLFHGTFLLDFDFRLMSDFLPMPSRQPAYRQNRTHESFLTNLPIPAISVKSALRACWNASEPMKCVPLETIASLTRDRYATIEWNFKF